ncbi:MAG: hypothetical protein CM15mP83_4730 [Flavobacteriaceae bacterium]|nr:MAG: hypothetical protein CM15mP83_4730 [Flavobacteriaceae bacterium]
MQLCMEIGGEITFIRSDYGIYYPKTEIIDLEAMSSFLIQQEQS